MIILIDNYDSFVFNLARYCQELGCETHVVRNDQITLRELSDLNPQAIILSPGPCTPLEAGNSLEIVRQFAGQIPILGVCLGHQTIAAALGGKVVRSPEPVHGRTALIRYESSRLFSNLPNPLQVTRYHSLIIDEESLPEELSVTARTDEGLPMALEHREWPLFGVQFHPESILSEAGHTLLSRFLKIAGCEVDDIKHQELLPEKVDLLEPMPDRPITPGPVGNWSRED